ncbi:MAG: tetratricopeptide repeat protein [Flavobacteriales bacterium]
MNKKIILSLLISSFTLVAFSQSKNVQNAFNSFRQENFAEAKHFIDLAANNESTANDAKMWNYRAKIYLEIMQKYPDIDENAVFEATESHIRCLDRDKKGRISVRKWTREEDILSGLIACGYNLFNSGVEDYNEKKYKNALRKYDEIFRIIPLDKDNLLERGNINENSIYKNQYLAALQLEDIDAQLDYLGKSIENNTEDPTIYYYISNIYSEKGDLNLALEYILKGREKFSNEIILINTEIDLSMKMGKSTQEIVSKLSDAIDLDNSNEVLYIIRSQMYSKLNDNVLAEKDLISALSINPESSSANNNLASLYLSMTEPLVKERNNLGYRETKKIDNLDSKIDELQKKSLPFLVKYISLKEVDGEFDKAALNTLASIYYNLGMEKESTETRSKLNSIK